MHVQIFSSPTSDFGGPCFLLLHLLFVVGITLKPREISGVDDGAWIIPGMKLFLKCRQLWKFVRSAGTISSLVNT